MSDRKLSAACRRALDVVAAWAGAASESNETNMDRGLVYWQSVRQLHDRGLITTTLAYSRHWLDLTDAGRAEALSAGPAASANQPESEAR